MEMSIERPLVELYMLSRDSAFVSLKSKRKEPIGLAWQENPSLPEAVYHASKINGHNVGLINGSLSGIVDVDLDCREAKHLASALLPKGLAAFGHSGNDRGHILYRVNDAGGTRQYQCPETGETLVELRSNGSQTMIPPSIHPSGHRLQFTFLDDTATALEFSELQVQVRKIAALSLIAKHWNVGIRHSLALGVAGLLMKTGYEEAQVKKIISGICEVTADEELNDRLRAVESTFEQPLENVAGLTQIEELLGAKLTKRVSDWLLHQNMTHSLDRTPDVVVLLNDTDDITEVRMSSAYSDWAVDKACYVAEKKYWFLWNGITWQPDIADKVTMLFQEFVDEAKDRADGSIFESSLKSFENRSKIKNALALAAPRLARYAEEFDNEEMLFAASNTWIDLTSGEEVDPTPTRLISMSSEVEYNPDAKCPDFLNFLNEIFCGDVELIEYIQRVVGYTLTSSMSEQCFFMLNGSGSNGKSTLVKVLDKLLGGYSKAAPEQTFLANQRSGVGDDLAFLSGARLVTMSELDKGQALAEAKIKRITGGDVITARELYGRNFRTKLCGKIFLATNSLPDVRGRDEGIFRRFQIIPFNRTFAYHERDKSLDDRLEQELSGILNWAIEGCLKWQTIGLAPPQVIEEQLDYYRRELDTVSKYFDAELELSAESRIGASELFQNYRYWCKSMGLSQQDEASFKTSMSKIDGVEWKRSNRGRYYSGVTYRSNAIEPSGDTSDILF
jgi:putative DNA primase/helicase